MRLALTNIAALCAALALAGAAYYGLCIWAARRYLRALPPASAFMPPASILKSLKGVDPHMYAAFRSHCLLDYPSYEVLFGVADLSEPALELVKRLQQEFPRHELRVVQCPQTLGANGKVSNLAQLLPKAAHEHIIINDSDITVPSDYLQRVMEPFAGSKVGMTTTLYRAIAGKTIPSKLEALGISTDFAGGVLVARELEGGIGFGLGATIATTKTVLSKIGGFEALMDYLGDDYELGARAARAGFRVKLADVVVETALPDYTFRHFWSHQIRWARNVKDRRKSQYFGLIVTFGLPWGVLAALLAPGAWWSWMSLALVALLRFWAALTSGLSVLQDRQVLRDLWLTPLRDFVALAVWIASYFGNEVEWRGQRFKLRNGKLQRVE